MDPWRLMAAFFHQTFTHKLPETSYSVSMNIRHLTPEDSEFPTCLLDIPQPPAELYVLGNDLRPLMDALRIAIVGTRKVSSYGRAVTSTLGGELARQGVVIISGLAIGVDTLAHRAALDNNGPTIAVLASGLDEIYPRFNTGLARQILQKGGALVSEYPPGTPSYKEHFVARNRLIAGLSEGVLVTEAGENSGSRHTVVFALEQGKQVMAVPGNITSPQSAGTNVFLRTGSASPVTSARDIYHDLGLELTSHHQTKLFTAEPNEAIILHLISKGLTDGAALLTKSALPTSVFNQALTMLELSGQIRSLGANQWSLA